MLLPHPEFDVSVSEQWVDYRCARCGHEAQASVTTTGTGMKLAGASLSRADLDARAGAAGMARLAACPRCGHRDRAALAKVVLLGAVVGALAAFGVGLWAAEQLRGSPAGGDLAVQAAVATFLAAVGATTALKLRSVRRRVTLHRVVR